MNPQMTAEQALKVVNEALSLPNFTLNRNDMRTVEIAIAQLQTTVEQVASLQAEAAELKGTVEKLTEQATSLVKLQDTLKGAQNKIDVLTKEREVILANACDTASQLEAAKDYIATENLR